MQEITCILELHRCIMRGGDARYIAQRPQVVAVIRKFQTMADKQRARSEAEAT
jgi:hypothetical protein